MFCLERENNVYVCRVVGLRITGGKREEQDWPKGLEQLGTTWPDLDEVYLGGGRGGGGSSQLSGYRNTRTASGHRGEF